MIKLLLKCIDCDSLLEYNLRLTDEKVMVLAKKCYKCQHTITELLQVSAISDSHYQDAFKLSKELSVADDEIKQLRHKIDRLGEEVRAGWECGVSKDVKITEMVSMISNLRHKLDSISSICNPCVATDSGCDLSYREVKNGHA